MATASKTKTGSVRRGTLTSAKKVLEPRSENPMDWLDDNPLGSYPNFAFGVLKQSYQGFRNSVLEFGLRKLRPVEGRLADGSIDPDALTTYRYGTVLPEDAPDDFDDPHVFLRGLEDAVCPQEPAMLIYLTLAYPEATRLHHCWEEARAFSFTAFARKRRLPVLLCQHRPVDAGSDNPVHLHLLISPRRLDGTGFRGYANELLCDGGQQLLFDEWVAFREAWLRHA